MIRTSFYKGLYKANLQLLRKNDSLIDRLAIWVIGMAIISESSLKNLPDISLSVKPSFFLSYVLEEVDLLIDKVDCFKVSKKKLWFAVLVFRICHKYTLFRNCRDRSYKIDFAFESPYILLT